MKKREFCGYFANKGGAGMEARAYKRRSTLGVVGLPDTVGVVFVTLALVLLLCPYLGGQDLGLFKVPMLSTGARLLLKWLGPALFLSAVALFYPAWSVREPGKPRSVLKAGKPPEDLVKIWARENGIGDAWHMGDIAWEQCCHDLGYEGGKNHRA